MIARLATAGRRRRGGLRHPLSPGDRRRGDRTGVEGAGPAWSPDGRWIAVSIGFHQGGTWTGGVPADGHIGLYDTQDRRLSPLTPPGCNFRDIRTGLTAMRGAFEPTWSPDGRRVAFSIWAQSHQGAEELVTQTVWVTDRDGANLRQAFEGRTRNARWSPDGARLTVEGSKDWPGGTVEVAALPVVELGAIPSPPAPLVAAMREAEQAAARTRAFDVAPILAANRAWMVPASDRLRSVGFFKAMEPREFDERFQWRGDGAMLSESPATRGDLPSDTAARPPSSRRAGRGIPSPPARATPGPRPGTPPRSEPRLSAT